MKTTVIINKVPPSNDNITVSEMEVGQYGIIIQDTAGGQYKDLMVVRCFNNSLISLIDPSLMWTWNSPYADPPHFIIQPINSIEISYELC